MIKAVIVCSLYLPLTVKLRVPLISSEFTLVTEVIDNSLSLLKVTILAFSTDARFVKTKL